LKLCTAGCKKAADRFKIVAASLYRVNKLLFISGFIINPIALNDDFLFCWIS
jgi:hypothetical protein